MPIPCLRREFDPNILFILNKDASGINPDDIIHIPVQLKVGGFEAGPSLDETYTEKYSTDWVIEFLEDSNYPENRLCVIHGDSGIGKSNLCKFLTKISKTRTDYKTQEVSGTGLYGSPSFQRLLILIANSDRMVKIFEDKNLKTMRNLVITGLKLGMEVSGLNKKVDTEVINEIAEQVINNMKEFLLNPVSGMEIVDENSSEKVFRLVSESLQDRIELESNVNWEEVLKNLNNFVETNLHLFLSRLIFNRNLTIDRSAKDLVQAFLASNAPQETERLLIVIDDVAVPGDLLDEFIVALREIVAEFDDFRVDFVIGVTPENYREKLRPIVDTLARRSIKVFFESDWWKEDDVFNKFINAYLKYVRFSSIETENCNQCDKNAECPAYGIFNDLLPLGENFVRMLFDVLSSSQAREHPGTIISLLSEILIGIPRGKTPFEILFETRSTIPRPYRELMKIIPEDLTSYETEIENVLQAATCYLDVPSDARFIERDIFKIDKSILEVWDYWFSDLILQMRKHVFGKIEGDTLYIGKIEPPIEKLTVIEKEIDGRDLVAVAEPLELNIPSGKVKFRIDVRKDIDVQNALLSFTGTLEEGFNLDSLGKNILGTEIELEEGEYDVQIEIIDIGNITFETGLKVIAEEKPVIIRIVQPKDGTILFGAKKTIFEAIVTRKAGNLISRIDLLVDKELKKTYKNGSTLETKIEDELDLEVGKHEIELVIEVGE